MFITDHTLLIVLIDSINRAGPKLTTLQQALMQNVMKILLFVFCFISFLHNFTYPNDTHMFYYILPVFQVSHAEA